MGPTPPGTGVTGVPGLTRQDREAFATGSLCKPVVEADECIPLRRLVTPDERRRQLERVGSAERVPGKEASGALPQGSRRCNDVDIGHQSLQSLECLSEGRGRQASLPMAPVER